MFEVSFKRKKPTLCKRKDMTVKMLSTIRHCTLLLAVLFSLSCNLQETGEPRRDIAVKSSAILGGFDCSTDPFSSNAVMITLGSDQTYRGSGIALTDEWVLTAAHVVQQNNGSTPPPVPFPADQLNVQWGGSDFSIVAQVDSVEWPSDFYGDAPTIGERDVAILKLKTKLPGVTPIASIWGGPSAQDSDILDKNIDCTCYGPNSASSPTGEGVCRYMQTKVSSLTGEKFVTEPNDLPTQYFLQGDSGCVCLRSDDGVLVGVLSNVDGQKGELVQSRYFADWLKAKMNSTTPKITADLNLQGASDELLLYDYEGARYAYVGFGEGGDYTQALTLSAVTGAFQALVYGAFGSDHIAAVVGGSLADIGVSNSGDFALAPNLAVSSYRTDYVALATTRFDDDSVDDLIAIRENGAQDLYLGSTGVGLSSVYALAFTWGDYNGDGVWDRSSIRNSDKYIAHVITDGSSGVGSLNSSNVNWQDPTVLAAGNFKDSSWEVSEGLLTDEVVLLLDGDLHIYVPTFKGQIPIWQSKFYDAPSTNKIVRITKIPGYSLGSIYDSLELVFADGSVIRLDGGAAGLTEAADPVSALPTAAGNDGKFLTVSGKGFGTIDAPAVSFRLVVPASQSNVKVEVFDGDIAAEYDDVSEVVPGTDTKACYQLFTDPCGDRTSNCTASGAVIKVAGKDNSAMLNNDWAVVYDASVNSEARSPSGNYIYRLDVFLANDCSASINEADPDANMMNAFKVKGTGVLGLRSGTLSFMGLDSAGEFGKPNAGDYGWILPDNDYDGRFDFYFYVGPAGKVQPDDNAGARWMILNEADADHLLAFPPGYGMGASDAISFSLVNPADATVLSLPDDLGNYPSGNYNTLTGEFGLNEYRVQPMQGLWKWHWNNIDAVNNIHLYAVHGSPVTYEMYGQPATRLSSSSAKTSTTWQTKSTGSYLPIVMGKVDGIGALLGSSYFVGNETQAAQILNNSSNDPLFVFTKELLAAKLNLAAASNAGEKLYTALLYGSTKTARTIVDEADALTERGLSNASVSTLSRMITLLKSINSGNTDYHRPGVPFPSNPNTDDDLDGIVNVMDNCPSESNIDQTDSNADGIGDACSVVPVLKCVAPKNESTYIAYVGYNNPLSYRYIPIGDDNHIAPLPEDRNQPMVFEAGLKPSVFEIEFGENETISWSLDGTTLTIEKSATQCTGAELTAIDFASNAPLFASEQLVLRDNVKVLAGGRPAGIVSNGNIEIGAGARVGDVFSSKDIFIRSRALVGGSAYAGGTISQQDGAVVLGKSVQGTYVPEHPLNMYVLFQAGPSINVEQDQSADLLPGYYGDVSIKSRSILNLKSGTYYFKSLNVEPGSELLLDQQDGPIVLYVESSITFRGIIASKQGAFPRLVMGFLGTSTATIEAPFQGILIAPQGEIRLATVTGTGHRGRFYAKKIEVQAGNQVTLVTTP